MGQMVHDEVARWGSAERHASIGVVLIAAAVTCYAVSWLQPPHQKPLALPVIAIAVFVIGAALVLAGDAVAISFTRSRVGSLWRRFMTPRP